MLSLYRSLLALRRRTGALTEGDYRPLDAGDDVFAYVRGERVAVALNFAPEPRRAAASGHGRLLLSTRPAAQRGVTVDLATLELAPDEGVIVELR